MPTSTHKHLQHWSCLPHISLGILGRVNVLGPSVWEVSATAGNVPVQACSPGASQSACDLIKHFKEHVQWVLYVYKHINIHRIALTLKHIELKIRGNPECQRSTKSAQALPQVLLTNVIGRMRRAERVCLICVMLSGHLSFVSPHIWVEYGCCGCSRDVFEMNWIHHF